MNADNEEENVVMPPTKKARKAQKTKCPDENLIVPNQQNFDLIQNSKYTLPELKSIAKLYKLKVTGTKAQLIERIDFYLRGSFYIVRLQKLWRGYIQRKAIQLAGPAMKNRSVCVNDSDFVTLEPLNEVPFRQFISFLDADNFIYGFDIVSLFNMMHESKRMNKEIKNPYTRRDFPSYFFPNMNRIVSIYKQLKRPLNLIFSTDETTNLSLDVQMEHRAVNLFQIINLFGHYSESKWLMNLSQNAMCRFVRELVETWNYRSQITAEVKKLICPPNGNPFQNVSAINNNNNFSDVKKIVLDVIERIITRAEKVEHRNLGAFYILGSLTLVSEEAANAMPWLYQSFR